ncbi:MAG: DUF3325 domain-containing protein [Lautropia sp.]|nr:DUF3325 domain-containing protein [Lautropia sp.]
MVELIWLMGGGAACLTGMAWLALAMAAHWIQVFPGYPHSPVLARRQRRLAAVALGFGLWACLQADHPSMAVLVWVMMLTASALLVAFSLTWRPLRLRRFWRSGWGWWPWQSGRGG